MKDFRVEEPKLWTQKATISQCSNNTKTSEKAWKEKKKSWRNQKRKQKNSTLLTEINITDTLKQNYNRPKRFDQNMDKIICYHCKNKDYYANKYLKLNN